MLAFARAYREETPPLCSGSICSPDSPWSRKAGTPASCGSSPAGAPATSPAADVIPAEAVSSFEETGEVGRSPHPVRTQAAAARHPTSMTAEWNARRDILALPSFGKRPTRHRRPGWDQPGQALRISGGKQAMLTWAAIAVPAHPPKGPSHPRDSQTASPGVDGFFGPAILCPGEAVRPSQIHAECPPGRLVSQPAGGSARRMAEAAPRAGHLGRDTTRSGGSGYARSLTPNPKRWWDRWKLKPFIVWCG